jgi:hypothetical protein
MRDDRRSWLLVSALLIFSCLSLHGLVKLAQFIFPRMSQVFTDIGGNGVGPWLLLFLLPLAYLLFFVWVLAAYGGGVPDKSNSSILTLLLNRKRTGLFGHGEHRRSELPRTQVPASLNGTEIMRPGLLGQSVLDSLLAAKRGMRNKSNASN